MRDLIFCAGTFDFVETCDEPDTGQLINNEVGSRSISASQGQNPNSQRPQ